MVLLLGQLVLGRFGVQLTALNGSMAVMLGVFLMLLVYGLGHQFLEVLGKMLHQVAGLDRNRALLMEVDIGLLRFMMVRELL